MDKDGVFAEVLYSELSAFRQFHLAGDHWKEVARAFNDSLVDFCSVDPARLVASYQLPIIDIEHAVAEVERLADLGPDRSNSRITRLSSGSSPTTTRRTTRCGQRCPRRR